MTAPFPLRRAEAAEPALSMRLRNGNGEISPQPTILFQLMTDLTLRVSLVEGRFEPIDGDGALALINASDTPDIRATYRLKDWVNFLRGDMLYGDDATELLEAYGFHDEDLPLGNKKESDSTALIINPAGGFFMTYVADGDPADLIEPNQEKPIPYGDEVYSGSRRGGQVAQYLRAIGYNASTEEPLPASERKKATAWTVMLDVHEHSAVSYSVHSPSARKPMYDFDTARGGAAYVIGEQNRSEVKRLAALFKSGEINTTTVGGKTFYTANWNCPGYPDDMLSLSFPVPVHEEWLKNRPLVVPAREAGEALDLAKRHYVDKLMDRYSDWCNGYITVNVGVEINRDDEFAWVVDDHFDICYSFTESNGEAPGERLGSPDYAHPDSAPNFFGHFDRHYEQVPRSLALTFDELKQAEDGLSKQLKQLRSEVRKQDKKIIASDHQAAVLPLYKAEAEVDYLYLVTKYIRESEANKASGKTIHPLAAEKETVKQHRFVGTHMLALLNAIERATGSLAPRLQDVQRHHLAARAGAPGLDSPAEEKRNDHAVAGIEPTY